MRKQLWEPQVSVGLVLLLWLIQPCSAQNPLECRRFDRGNRFEGTAPTAAGDFVLEVASVTAYFEDFRPNSTLRVNFFLPVGESQAQVLAEELNPQKGY